MRARLEILALFVLIFALAGKVVTGADPTTSIFSTARADQLDPTFSNYDKVKKGNINSGKITLITGGVEYVSNTYMQLAMELAGALDVRGKLRVLPLAGYGSVRNVEDLLYLKGVDIGMVHSDVFTHLDQIGELPIAKDRLRYIVRLYDEFFHVLAHNDYTDVTQLAGRKVAVAKPGSGGEMSASTLFALMGVKPIFVHIPWKEAVQKIKSGELAAMVYPTRKSSKLLLGIDPSDELHILPLKLAGNMRDTYEAAEFTNDDYPNLVAGGTPVPTLKFGAVLAVYNWKKNRARYNTVSTFISGLFENLEKLKESQRHSVWQDLDPNASVLGWKRYGPAKQWLKRIADRRKQATASAASSPIAGDNKFLISFQRFIQVMGADGGLDNRTDEEILKLYRRFVELEDLERQR